MEPVRQPVRTSRRHTTTGALAAPLRDDVKAGRGPGDGAGGIRGSSTFSSRRLRLSPIANQHKTALHASSLASPLASPRGSLQSSLLLSLPDPSATRAYKGARRKRRFKLRFKALLQVVWLTLMLGVTFLLTSICLLQWLQSCPVMQVEKKVNLGAYCQQGLFTYPYVGVSVVTQSEVIVMCWANGDAFPPNHTNVVTVSLTPPYSMQREVEFSKSIINAVAANPIDNTLLFANTWGAQPGMNATFNRVSRNKLWRRPESVPMQQQQPFKMWVAPDGKYAFVFQGRPEDKGYPTSLSAWSLEGKLTQTDMYVWNNRPLLLNWLGVTPDTTGKHAYVLWSPSQTAARVDDRLDLFQISLGASLSLVKQNSLAGYGFTPQFLASTFLGNSLYVGTAEGYLAVSPASLEPRLTFKSFSHAVTGPSGWEGYRGGVGAGFGDIKTEMLYWVTIDMEPAQGITRSGIWRANTSPAWLSQFVVGPGSMALPVDPAQMKCCDSVGFSHDTALERYDDDDEASGRLVLVSAASAAVWVVNGTDCRLAEGFGIAVGASVLQVVMAVGCLCCIRCQSNRDLKDLFSECCLCCWGWLYYTDEEDKQLVEENSFFIPAPERPRANSAHF